jgi:ABC-type transport system involved in cytochrome bd biosynthesis fused ATPase/permease subunit
MRVRTLFAKRSRLIHSITGHRNTSAIGADRATEIQVYDSVFEHFDDACIVSSVHRLQLLDRFDEVLLKAGRLVAQGPVAQLAARSRDFQELVGIAEFTQAAVSVAA